MMKRVLTALAFAGVWGAFGSPAIAQEALVNPTCNSQAASCLYQKEVYRLQRMTLTCLVQKKVVENMTYSICRSNGKVVSASESLTSEGDGMGYWFRKGRVVAIRYFHDGSLVTFKNGKALAHYVDEGSEMQTQLSREARQQFESAAATGARSILKQFGL
jgi:hypothetical protein